MSKQFRSTATQKSTGGNANATGNNAAGMGMEDSNQEVVERWKASKGGKTPEAIIEQYTNYGGLNLQEVELAAHLLNMLPGNASLVDQVFDALGNGNRDDVAYYMAANATDAQLKRIASGGAAALLFRLMEELQGGATGGGEAEQMERLIRCSSPTHERLKNEAASKDPQVQAGLLAEGATLQSIANGSGDYIYDEYSVVIDAMPTGLRAEDFLAEMATDLNKAVNDDLFNAINTFERRPTTPTPELGNIYDIDIGGPDNGSVVLVESTSDHFVFQTVTTSETGTHPEYGSRQFGFEEQSDGSIKFYTRGASRPSNAAVGVAGRGPQAVGWTRLMKGISNAIKARGGSPRGSSFECWSTHQ